MVNRGLPRDLETRRWSWKEVRKDHGSLRMPVSLPSLPSLSRAGRASSPSRATGSRVQSGRCNPAPIPWVCTRGGCLTSRWADTSAGKPRAHQPLCECVRFTFLGISYKRLFRNLKGFLTVLYMSNIMAYLPYCWYWSWIYGSLIVS